VIKLTTRSYLANGRILQYQFHIHRKGEIELADPDKEDDRGGGDLEQRYLDTFYNLK
jgi:hypothetical protein